MSMQSGVYMLSLVFPAGSTEPVRLSIGTQACLVVLLEATLEVLSILLTNEARKNMVALNVSWTRTTARRNRCCILFPCRCNGSSATNQPQTRNPFMITSSVPRHRLVPSLSWRSREEVSHEARFCNPAASCTANPTIPQTR